MSKLSETSSVQHCTAGDALNLQLFLIEFFSALEQPTHIKGISDRDQLLESSLVGINDEFSAYFEMCLIGLLEQFFGKNDFSFFCCIFLQSYISCERKQHAWN